MFCTSDNSMEQVKLTAPGMRVWLRPPMRLDGDVWRDIRGRNAKYLKPYEPRWHADALTEDFFKRRLARQKTDWQNGHAYAFLIFKDAGAGDGEGVLIGGVNINNVYRGAAQSASLGYWMDEEHQGQGYMGEALSLIIDFAGEVLRLHRLHAAILPHNQRSQRVLEKLCFAEEGFAKSYIKIDGRWQDHILFGRVLEPVAMKSFRNLW